MEEEEEVRPGILESSSTLSDVLSLPSGEKLTWSAYRRFLLSEDSMASDC